MVSEKPGSRVFDLRVFLCARCGSILDAVCRDTKRATSIPNHLACFRSVRLFVVLLRASSDWETQDASYYDGVMVGGNTSGGFFSRLGRRLACAAEFGDAHSLAAATGTQDSFLGKAFLGNTFSGLTQLGLLAAGGPSSATATDVGIAMLSGTHQGLPGGGNIGKGEKPCDCFFLKEFLQSYPHLQLPPPTQ
jgi:hypothetical protein